MIIILFILDNVENVRNLIKNQNLNVENRRGLTPLGVAVEKGYLSDVRLFKNSNEKWKNFFVGNERIVNLLILGGANVNFSKTALNSAVENGT